MRLTVRNALIASLLGLLLMMAGQSAYFHWQLGTSSDEIEELANDEIATFSLLGEIKAQMLRLRMQAFQLAAEADPSMRRTHKADYDATVKSLTALVARYDAMPRVEEEKKPWESFKGLWSAFSRSSGALAGQDALDMAGRLAENTNLQPDFDLALAAMASTPSARSVRRPPPPATRSNQCPNASISPV